MAASTRPAPTAAGTAAWSARSRTPSRVTDPHRARPPDAAAPGGSQRGVQAGAQRLEAAEARLPPELTASLARVHDRRAADGFRPLGDGRGEREPGDGACAGLDDPARRGEGREPELARHLHPAEHAVTGDVVGAGRSGPDDREGQCLTDI